MQVPPGPPRPVAVGTDIVSVGIFAFSPMWRYRQHLDLL
jgi:hypothetical protein